MIDLSMTNQYVYSETIADGENGQPIYLYPLKRNVSCRIHTEENTGKFQTTLSSLNAIKNNTALWSDWDKGSITGTDSDVIIGQITGLRGVSESGEIVIEVLI